MPEATLTFSLPEEEGPFNLALKGPRWFSAAHDFDQWLRNKLKHGEMSKPVRDALDECRSKFHECLSDEGVSFDDVT